MIYSFNKVSGLLMAMAIIVTPLTASAGEVKLMCPFTLDSVLIVSINQETNTHSVTVRENNGQETTTQASLVASEPNYMLGYLQPELNRGDSTKTITQLTINRTDGIFHYEHFMKFRTGKISMLNDLRVGSKPCSKAEDVKQLF